MLFDRIRRALQLPNVPLNNAEVERDHLRDVVAQTSHGNLYLQAGNFYFADDAQKELNELEKWSFRAGRPR